MKRNCTFILVLLYFIGLSVSFATTYEDLRTEQVSSRNITEKTLMISAVGDIMFHMPQVDSAYDAAAKTYGFEKWFRLVSPWFETRDFVIGNLETTLSKNGPYRGYPAFKSPAEIATDLTSAGFNVLTTANNHCYDAGFSGVASTIDILDAAAIQHTGTSSKEGEKPYVLLEKKGYKVALFAYTYSTNGISVPQNKSFSVNLIDTQKMKIDLDSRPQDTDFTIVSVHFGNEYQRQPSAAQIELVSWLRTQNVDVVLGSHPHVLQKDSPSISQDFYAIYSMGNFISNQRERYKDSGVIVNLNLSIEKGKKKIQVNLIPTWVDKDTAYTIVPLNNHFLSTNKHLTPSDFVTLNQSKKDFYELFPLYK